MSQSDLIGVLGCPGFSTANAVGMPLALANKASQPTPPLSAMLCTSCSNNRFSSTRLPPLAGFTGTCAGLGAVIDVTLAHPLGRRHRMDSEIGGDLRTTGSARQGSLPVV